MAQTTSDPIRAWFHSAEDLGEYIGIRFGRLAPGTTEPEWFFLRHTDFDGIGGLADLLRRRGAKIERLPGVKHPSEPSIGHLLRASPKYLKPRHALKWRSLTPDPSAQTKGNPPRAFAWHIFTEEETTQIRRVCRKANYTVNSFLLKHLTKAIRPCLQDESSVVPWMVPVNVRGKVARDKDVENHSSYVCVNIASYETVYDVHRSIYAALARGEHWANWYSYKSGGFTTNGIRKFLIAKGLAVSQWNIGGFSNLGDWDPDKTITQADCQGGWFFAPPVLRCQHIGAGCVTFQNRLSTLIQVHPELTSDPAVPKAWVHDWVKEIEIDVVSVLDGMTKFSSKDPNMLKCP
jgi:hypothetical protein